MTRSPLTSLAEKLLEKAKALDAYNESHGLPPASFEHESFIDVPLELEDTRKAVIDLAQDVKRLAQGPRDLLFEILNLSTDLANLHFIYHHRIPQVVPPNGAISKPSAAKMIAAMQKYPSSGEPNETAFNLAFNTSRSFYQELDMEPERSRRFGGAMTWVSHGGQFSTEHLAQGFDWARFDHEKATMVDVGGGHGAVSMSIAKATRKLRFVVQDLPATVSDGARLLPTALKGRVSFMPHDFFVEQPVKGADVYFLRYILHNWSDKYAQRILKTLVPALKDGSSIVCCEFLPGDRSTTSWSKKQPYHMDMIQAIGWNSIERTSSDWARLFESVDPRLQYSGTRTPPGCSVSLIEARFCAGPAKNM
ncbi:hypothetical protein ONZ43_g1925 [Nemania bipapillata]|uniref:Uncharacterized protein n=1 Tax=Nemania bipapillata TaxID=110536 RepID=A0ACC2J2T4_9PEZI|nr:hypothetical protein ONZ43_g1925 [Nemania bipapillata]